jgi:hypothetical protein
MPDLRFYIKKNQNNPTVLFFYLLSINTTCLKGIRYFRLLTVSVQYKTIRMNLNYCIRKICLVLTAQTFAFFVSAQDKPVAAPALIPGAPIAAPPKPGTKPYKEVITDKAKTSKGLFTVHKLEDKYYFEIPAKLLGRDILVINRISKSSIESPKGFGGYAGLKRDQIIKYF